uniref:Retrotransposon gag domain-containing protein n=1 Tax=Hippocampus comes TaxID=109280 RepID=A0A3Q2YKM3_HIPCM
TDGVKVTLTSAAVFGALNPDSRVRNVCPPTVEPNIPHPSHYGGDPGSCSQFIHHSKVTFVMSLLTGQASSWARAVSNARPELRSPFSEFLADFHRVFHHPVPGQEAKRQLLEFNQGSRSVADYSLKFCI